MLKQWKVSHSTLTKIGLINVVLLVLHAFVTVSNYGVLLTTSVLKKQYDSEASESTIILIDNATTINDTYNITNNDTSMNLGTTNKKHTLPNFKNGTEGGIVIYYHVAKTGGSTIRDIFEQLAMFMKDSTSFTYRRLNKNPSNNVAADQYSASANTVSSSSTFPCTPRHESRKKDHLERLDEYYINKCTKSKDENNSGGNGEDSTELLEVHNWSCGITAGQHDQCMRVLITTTHLRYA